jgi:hypothetical protein
MKHDTNGRTNSQTFVEEIVKDLSLIAEDLGNGIFKVHFKFDVSGSACGCMWN